MLNSALYFFWPEGMMDQTWLDEGVSPGVAIADAMSLTETADGHIIATLVVKSFRKLPMEEILKRLEAEDVPCGPVHALEEVHLDAQIVHNHALVEWEHPTAGRLRQPRPGAEFGGTPVQPRYMVAALGQHPEEVLASPTRTLD
jgi:crotonobetainyl-CoA:carnitine CoA-transferase CaiB-like acyl-CoA transferase